VELAVRSRSRDGRRERGGRSLRSQTVGEPLELLSEFVEERLEQWRLPGLAIAIVTRDGLVASAGFGLADVARKEPVTPETRFAIGSIGKSFTAAVLMRLCEEGRVDLGAPLTAYLPWFEGGPGPAPITLHQLLTHTAGLVRGSDVTADSRFDVWALREAPRSEPGRHFHYSNVGFRALGYVIEEVTGRRYPDVVRAQILEPLAMDGADAAITHETRKRLAVGYEYWYDDRPPRRDHAHVPAPWLETDTGDGSIAASAEELGAFACMLLNRGEPLLAPASFELMCRAAVEAAEDSWYGYGIGTTLVAGRRLVGHLGGMPGFRSALRADLEAGLGTVVLLNGPDEGNLKGEVAAFTLDLYRAAAEGARLPEPSHPDPLAVADADEYAGRYSGAEAELVLEATEGRLVLVRGGERIALEQRGGDRFLVPDDDFALFLLAFRRDGDAVVEAWHGPDRYVRAGAAPERLCEPAAEWHAYQGHYRAYNPWHSNFRVVGRGDRLDLIYPFGAEEPLASLPDGSFRVGEDAWSPERIRFDAVVDDRTLRANLSGCDYYRTAAP